MFSCYNIVMNIIVMDIAKFLRTPFLENTSGGCSWMAVSDSTPEAVIVSKILFLTAIKNKQESRLALNLGSPRFAL